MEEREQAPQESPASVSMKGFHGDTILLDERPLGPRPVSASSGVPVRKHRSRAKPKQTRACQSALEGFRYLISSVLTLFCLGLVAVAVWEEQILMPGPVVLHYACLVLGITLLAYVEGLQVAILAVRHVSVTKASVYLCLLSACVFLVLTVSPCGQAVTESRGLTRALSVHKFAMRYCGPQGDAA